LWWGRGVCGIEPLMTAFLELEFLFSPPQTLQLICMYPSPLKLRILRLPLDSDHVSQYLQAANNYKYNILVF